MITVAPPMPRVYVAPTGDTTGAADGAAIAAAIAEIPAAGGTLVLLPGTYYVGTTGSATAGVNLTGRSNVAIIGEGGEWGGCEINYAGTGRAIDARGKANDGLYFCALTIHSTTASTLLDLGNLSGNTTDASTSGTRIERVQFIGGSGGTPTLLRLSQALTTHVADCAFSGGAIAILGLDQNGAFSNTIQVTSCWFEYQATVPVKNPGQNWLIQGCTFEPLSTGVAAAVLSDATTPGILNLTYLANSHQDSTTSAGSAWLNLQGAGASILANTFVGHADNHVKTGAAMQGLTIIGNTFENDDVAPVALTGSCAQFVMIGNYWNTANLLSGTPATPALYETNSNQMRLSGYLDVLNGVAFYGAAAVAQQTAAGETAGFTAGTGTAMNNASTSTGGTGTTAYTFGDVIHALKTYGLLAS